MNHTRIFTALLLLLVTVALACDGCDRNGVDEDAQQRVDELASLIPGTTDVALVAPELGELPGTLDYVFGRADQLQADGELLERNINQSLGFRISDKESWDAAGFDTDGSMIFSMVGARPVLAVHIDDENSFETHVIGRLREQFHAETPIDTQEFGDRSFRVSGAGMADDMAWFYEGSAVVLVMPPFDVFDVFETGTATSVANKMGGMDTEASLAHSDAFGDFRNSIGDEYPVSLYVHAERYLDRPVVDDDQIGVAGFDTIARGMVDWAQGNTKSTGIGFEAGDQTLKLHGFAAGDEEVVNEARQAFATDHDVDWDGLLTENTTVAVRTAVDLSSLLDTYLNNLPDEQRRTIERDISQIGHNHDMDLQEDILQALSGHSLLVFYGLAGGASDAMGQFMAGDVGGGLQTVSQYSGLAANFHFADADKKADLFDYASEFAGDYIEDRPLKYDGDDIEEIRVLQPADTGLFPLRLFTDDYSATFTTTGINEQSAYEYLTNQREEGRLSDGDLPLGAEFASSQGVNGIYANFGNLADNMRDLGSAAAAYAGIIDVLEELLITTGVEDDGLHARAQLTFSEPLDDDTR